MNTTVIRSAAVVMVLAAAACSQRDQCGIPNSRVFTVHLQESAVSPVNAFISCNTTVRWVNDLAVAHTIAPDNPGQAGVWQTQNIAAQVNAEFSHRFNVPGTYPYRCTIHSGETGVVSVSTGGFPLGSRLVRLLQRFLAGEPGTRDATRA